MPLPKPFQRPSIDLSDPGQSRSWRTIWAKNLSEGDIVPDRGRVVSVESGYTDPAQVRVEFLSGDRIYYTTHEQVWAFTQGEPVGQRE